MSNDIPAPQWKPGPGAKTKNDFALLCSAVQAQSGVRIDERKRPFALARFRKRMQALDIESLEIYSLHALKNTDELQACIEAVVTHHTQFFREQAHFDSLSKNLLAGVSGEFRVWCAACSSGEEAYTLAITLDQWARLGLGRSYAVHASDISERVLQVASAGVYSQEALALALPRADWLSSYFQKGTGSQLGKCRVKADLRANVHFYLHNVLRQTTGEMIGSMPVDAIFCRNVLIYFEASTQAMVVDRLLSCLKPSGHLFVGLTEHVSVQAHNVTSLGGGIYKKL